MGKSRTTILTAVNGRQDGENSSRGNSGGGGRVGIEFFQHERTPEHYSREAARQAIIHDIQQAHTILVGLAGRDLAEPDGVAKRREPKARSKRERDSLVSQA